MTTGSRRERGLESTGDLLAGVTDIGLRRQLERFGKLIEARAQEKKPEEPAPQTAKIIQLPLWPEPKRGVPNSVLRGALFAAIQSKNRRYMKKELLVTQDGIEIYFTGMQLEQSDLDVWEQALHLAREHPLGTECHFTAYGFLKKLGRSTGTSDVEWLSSSLSRMVACAVHFKHEKLGLSYTGSLISNFIKDENDQNNRYFLRIEPETSALYRAGWTAIDWEERKKLKRKPLALWLHGFYASHARAHPLSVEYLHKMSGSRTKRIRKFKESLIAAFEDLETISAIRGFEVKDGLVYVDNVPSDSQQKHLNKNRPGRK